MIPLEVWEGLMIPFLGTSIGAFSVFLLNGTIHPTIQRGLTGFAAGIMTAASVWSLLIPAMEQVSKLGRLAFLPAVGGFWLGVLFLLALDHTIPHLHMYSEKAEGHTSRLKRTTMLVLAVTLHNVPEGMAVGVVYAGWMAGNKGLTLMGAAALSIGIAIQNFPEGAIVSLPLHAQGMGRPKALLYGVLSGVVEPIAAIITILASQFILPILPSLLSLAAGAMLYVVVEELVPEMSQGEHSDVGVVLFSIGFTLMMALDVALG
jgi:ZIP family zinc transporter